MTDGGFPTMDGRRIGGRDVDWQKADMTQPPEDSSSSKAVVPLAGLVEVGLVVLAIVLVVVGCVVAWGLAGGLISGGGGIFVAVLWSRKDGAV